MPTLLEPIVGRMDCEPATKTAQAATRIGFICPIDKFLAKNKTLPKVDLLKLWTKQHRVFTDDGKVMKDWRKEYAVHFSRYATDEPYEGCFELTVIFTYTWPKSWPKKIKENSKWSFRKSTPDTDNLLKAFKDCMERAGIVKNDSMVVRDIVEKRYGPVPGISWRLRPLMEHQAKPGLFPEV